MAYSPQQIRLARTLVQRGRRNRATPREIIANLETGIVEAGLTNPKGGSGSSVGYRQETASSYPNVNRLDVKAAADRFYREARAKRGMRGSAGSLAQAVQRSAFPARYDQVSSQAKALYRQLGGSQGAAGGTGGADPGGLALITQNGSQPTLNTDTTAVDLLAQQLAPKPQAPLGYLPPPAFTAKPPLPTATQVPQPSPAPMPQADLGEQLQAISKLVGVQPPVQPQTTVVGVQGGSTREGGSPIGGRGKVKVASGADRAGAGIKPVVTNFVADVAGRAHRPITITTGTNHNRLTVDGNVSDHWDGHAADIAVPVDSHQGDVIAAAALEQAGVPWKRARQMARHGGLYTLHHNGQRIQVIWKTYQGGNHHNHVHIGVRPGR